MARASTGSAKANGASPDERLRYLIHLSRGLHPSVDFLFFQRILQSESIDDGGKHPHVIGGNAVHISRLICNSAKKIPSAHHNGQLYAHLINVCQFRRDLVNPRRVHAKTLIGGQSFAGDLQQNALKGWSGSSHVGS